MTAGLGCDGDTVAMTGASQPSIEDLVLGGIPGIPKVRFHNPFLAYEVGEDFMKFFYAAAAGRIDPFILIVEGSIPNEKNKAGGYWASFGTDPTTGQPITTCEWIDRLAPKAWAIIGAGTCAAYGGIHAMHGNPTDAMGLADYLGWEWNQRRASRSSTLRAVPFTPIALWGHCSTCFKWPPTVCRHASFDEQRTVVEETGARLMKTCWRLGKNSCGILTQARAP